MKPVENIVVWRPQAGPQHDLVTCPLPEIFFGGARAGGKTDGVLGKYALKAQRYGEHFNAMMFRRTTVSAEDAIERSRQIYGPLGATFNSTKLIWRMPNGGRVGFGYLENPQDAEEWQGRNLTDAWIEEAGQYPDSRAIDRMQATLRSAHGVPTQLILTANPGGSGQHWLRDRYQLYPFPKQALVLERELPNGHSVKVAVIPSRITDNRILLDADPGYIDRLYQVGSDELVRAWLDGDWSAIEGAFFDCWNTKFHVVEPFDVPDDWLRFRSMDWGSASPFSVGWWAVVGERYKHLERGAILRYREWYGAAPKGGGLKLSNEDVARGVVERSLGEKYAYSVLDPSAFATQGGPSIAEQYARCNFWCRKADNRRVGAAGAMSGWAQMRNRMKHNMIACFDTCRDSIRTIPVLQHNPDRPEDLNTEAEDHAADEWRYACMSRPYIPAHTQSDQTIKFLHQMTYDEFHDSQKRRFRERV